MGNITYEILEKLFLSGYPLNKWCWSDVFELLLGDVIQNQHLILNSTINHYMTQKYPLKVSYQLKFLKILLNKLEEEQLEVIDEFYEAYCQLLGKNETEKHYRHLPLNDTFVSLRESSKLVSEGTTGLHVWQASMALAEWCLENKETHLKGKNILELGSGVGMTGLACIAGTRDFAGESLQECSASRKQTLAEICSKNSKSAKSSLFSPKRFTFSDCHPSVLRLLCQNVKHNLLGDEELNKKLESTEDKVTENVIFNADFHGMEIRVLKLPWEDLNEGCEEAVLAVGDVDFVVAADVVYEESLFSPLVGSLKRLITSKNSNGKFPSAVIACTERNTETIKAFLDHISASGLKAVEEDAIIPKHFVYEAVPSVHIYIITSQ